LFAEALRFLLFGRQWPNSPDKALHERNAQNEDDTRANGCEHIGRHGLIFPGTVRLSAGNGLAERRADLSQPALGAIERAALGSRVGDLQVDGPACSITSLARAHAKLSGVCA